jgi:acyl-CoA thioesterase FadM
MFNDPNRQGRFMFTANMHIHYRKNVPTGQQLKLVGKAGISKRRTAQARGEIYGPEGELLAEAELVLVDIPDTYTQSADLESTGWKVYPE